LSGDFQMMLAAHEREAFAQLENQVPNVLDELTFKVTL
jgi:hypothetical protein